MIARCQPGYFFLPSLSVLLIFLPPAVHVQDGTDGAGQIGRGTQDFKKQVHRPLQSEIEALPADGFRGGQILTERDGACMPCRHRVQPDTYLATRSVCARTHILQPDPCAHGPTSCIRKEGVTLRTAPAAGPNQPGVFARCGNVYTFRLQRQASRGCRPARIGRAGKARRAA